MTGDIVTHHACTTTRKSIRSSASARNDSGNYYKIMKGSYTAFAVAAYWYNQMFVLYNFTSSMCTRESCGMLHLISHWETVMSCGRLSARVFRTRDIKQNILVLPQTGSKAVVLGDLE